MWFLALLLVTLVAGCSGDDNNGGGNPDITAPTVSSTSPANNATGVAVNTAITATFSEALDAATITVSTFTLDNGVTGTVTYDATNMIATFTPSSNLAYSTTYTSTITTGVKDSAGNAMASNYTWSFTTGTAPDTTAPTVSSTSPANNATAVAVNTAITATFSETMTASTITTATFTVGGVTGTVTYSGTTATFTPSSNLAANTIFTATITTGAKDLAGNALAVNKTWSFTTATPDTTAPTVSSTSPVDTATGVAINKKITATFSEAMAPATITTTTFTVTAPGPTSVSGTVTYAGTTATFTPSSNLAVSTLFTATITTGVKDLADNALTVNKVWSFTTGTTTAAGPAPVNLGTAGNFVILAKSGISTVPTSAITGDIGVSPIDQTAITGFSETLDGTGTFSTSIQVTGKIYAADYAVPTPSNLTTAVSDMETAYTDAAGRTLPDATELGAGEIGGLTIVPGLYKWGTGVLISTDVTLSGGPNDVWIFQIAGGITQANGKSVILTGGALPKNIFWQSFGVVDLGTTAHFEGIILAQTAITLNTGATVNGRLLAQTAVTLASSTVVQPAP